MERLKGKLTFANVVADEIEQGDASAVANLASLEGRLKSLEAENEALSSTVDELTTTLTGVRREGTTLVFEGMNLQLLNGPFGDPQTNGLGNLIVGHNEQPGPNPGRPTS